MRQSTSNKTEALSMQWIASLLAPPSADVVRRRRRRIRRLYEGVPTKRFVSDDAVPIALLANLLISNHTGRTKERLRTRGEHTNVGGSAMRSTKDIESEGDDDSNVGVAIETYFMPGPATDLHLRKTLIERRSPPEILVHGRVNAENVE